MFGQVGAKGRETIVVRNFHIMPNGRRIPLPATGSMMKFGLPSRPWGTKYF